MIALSLLLSAASGATLTLEEVLSSLDARVPELAAADAKIEQAEGKRMTATGAFDPALSGKIGSYLGKEPRDITSVGVSVQTIAGPELSAGFRRGTGVFPAYAGEDETSSAGELWAGAVIPLLDGLVVTEGRADLREADADLALARIDRAAKQIDTVRKATEAHARWVAAGARLEIDRQLLTLAESRDAALLREVETGARARLDWVDNQRVVQQRRNDVLKSEADLGAAALQLSLLFRSPEGAPLVPQPSDLPPFAPAPTAELPDPGAPDKTPAILAFSPLLDAANARWQRSRSALLPDLSAIVEGSTDPIKGEEIVLGAELKIAPLLRKERGYVTAERAKIDAFEAERRAARDRLVAEIEAARIAAVAAEQRLAGAAEAQRAADEVLTLEQRRVNLGGTDLFALLVRESAAAAARRATVDAWLEREIALARYQALSTGI